MRRHGGRPLLGLFAWLLAACMFWPALASAQTSPYCPAQNITVANGGTVTSINLINCDGPFNFGMGGPFAPFLPVNGSIILSSQSGPGNQTVTYTHNGSATTTDTFAIEDENGDELFFNVTITAPASAIVVSPASLPALTAGTPFSQTLTSTGGVAPYTYTLSGGTLPPGLTLSAAGVLSGTPTQRGGYAFGVRSQDNIGDFVVKGYNGTVQNPSLALVQASVTPIQGLSFYQALSTAGGVAPHTYLLETGAFPAGISISSAGVVSGTTAVAPGNYPVTLRVTDASTGLGSYFELEAFTVTVSAAPSVSITVAPATVSEDGAPNLIYTVTRSLNLSSPTVVNITTGGMATSGVDYTGGVATLSIPAGATTATITINPTADATFEANESVTMGVAPSAAYTIGAPAIATGYILNDDLTTLSINDVTLAEGNAGTSNATFTVSLSAPAAAGGVTFDIATANGTATAGVDYVANSLTGQTIPAGASTYTFTVLINGDPLYEPSKNFSVTVTNVTNAVVASGMGLGTIINDDSMPTLAINDVTVTEGNAGTINAMFTVTLDAASGLPATVNYATSDGTAVAPGDYTAASGTLTFAAGVVTQTVTVSVNGDVTPEANETFQVGLSGAVGAIIADTTGVGTITNDDVPVTVTPTTVPNGTVAAAYSQLLGASGGTGSYGFAVTAGALPAGLSLSPGGALSGTPTAGGSFNFTVTATDSSPLPGPYSGSRAYTLVIDPPTVVLPATALAGGTLGAAYSAAIAPASGGTAPYGYAVTAGALPGGLTVNASTGAITGTPSAPGTFNFSITATDSTTGTGPFTATRAYSITVIDNPPVANAVSVTVAYGSGLNPVTLNITGGAPTTVAIGTAPTHGTAIATGTSIAYQPTAGYAGPDSFTYTATNGGGTSAPATVTVTVSNPVSSITASGGFSATVGVAYTQTFTWNGGAPPWTSYQVTNLPAGLSITGTTANSATVSGTPTQAGSFSLNASATDSSTGNGPFTVAQAFTLTVTGPGLSLAPAAGTFYAPYGVAYSQAFTASGGIGPYTYASTGSLPPGVSFAGNTASGTPTTPGSYSFTITATDTGSTGVGAPFTVAQNYTINVAVPTVAIVPTSVPNPMAGTAYSQTLTASGGIGPYGFALTAGALPSGLNLSAAGVLSGTSNQVGTYNFTVTATDANGQTGNRAYTVTIAAPTLTLTPATGTLTAPYGAPYAQAFTAAGGSGSFSYAVTGSLPAGLSFSSNTLAGTPIAPGSYPITITATDTVLTGAGAPFSVTQNYTIDVPAPTMTVDPATLPDTTAGLAYNQTLTANGGVGPYTFAVTAGILPGGLALSSAGALSGTTTTSGTFSFTVTVTDTYGLTAFRAYTVAVAVPTITLNPATLPAAIAGTAYNQVLTVAGGIAPYTVTQTGTLPAGLSFDAGMLTFSGTPSQSGTFNISVTATDSTGGTAATVTNSYTLVIAAPTLTLTPATVPAGTAGVAYAQTFVAGGGVAPYAYTVSAGALPAGVTLQPATGALSGTPTVAGSFGFSVTATDSTTGTAGSITQAYTLEVSAPMITLTPETLAAGTYMAAYAQQLTATGGTAPYRFTVTAGTLPSGMSLDQNGRLSGAPDATGSFTFTVTATDALDFTGTRAYTLVIAQRPDPSQDPEVRGLINAQAEAARRFTTSQIGNFQQRLQRLHGPGNASGFSNSLSVATRACMPGADIAPGNNRCDLQRQQPYDAIGAAPTEAGAGSAAPSNVSTAFGVWAAGMLRSGNVDSRGSTSELTFETDGMSAGADYRISERVVLGMGVGYGRDRTYVGENGSRSDARAYTLAGYASVSPGERFFIDTMLGYQTLDFELRRHVTADGSMAAGSRNGSQWFGSVSAGADLAYRNNLQVTPYVRLDVAQGELDGYAEQANASNALTYGKMDVESTTGNAGVRFDWRRQTAWGSISPQLKAEYQHDFSGSGTATLQYSDLLQVPFYRTALDGYDRDRWVLGAGLQFNWDTGWGLRVDYHAQMSGQSNDHGLEFHLDAKF